MSDKGTITQFMLDHYKHFNSASLVDASEAYKIQLNQGNKMLISLAGAMSTAELGKSLSEMIRNDKLHIISLGSGVRLAGGDRRGIAGGSQSRHRLSVRLPRESERRSVVDDP